MDKRQIFQRELEKLTKIFADVDEGKRKLVEGLIEDAAFLKAENTILRQIMEPIGMVKVHPTNPELQKPIAAAKEYRQNINSYSVIIKTLNGVLNKNIIDDDDELNEFE